MSIKQHFQTALQGIIGEKDRAIAMAKEKANKEVVAPHNVEVDAACNEAIAEITTAHNKTMADLQAQFNAQRQSLVEDCAKKKSDFAENAIAQAVAVVSVEYDNAVAALEKQISEIKE